MPIGHWLALAEWDVFSFTMKQEQTPITLIHETFTRLPISHPFKKKNQSCCSLYPIITFLRFNEWSNWTLKFENSSICCILILRSGKQHENECTEWGNIAASP